MLAMINKQGMCTDKRWRRIRGFGCLAKVIKGVKFKDGAGVSNDRNEGNRVAV